jgi:hypothetical protein
LSSSLSLSSSSGTDTKGDDDVDGDDGEKEISPTKVFLCRLSRRRREKATTTLTFFMIFWSKPPQKVAAAAAFGQDHPEEQRERERKRYEKKMSHSKHSESVGFRRLMNNIYVYTTSPLQRGETSTRVTSRSSSFLNKASPRAFHSDLRFLKIFLFSHGM